MQFNFPLIHYELLLSRHAVSLQLLISHRCCVVVLQEHIDSADSLAANGAVWSCQHASLLEEASPIARWLNTAGECMSYDSQLLRDLLSLFHYLQLLFLLFFISSLFLAPLLHFRNALFDFCSILGFQHYLVSARVTETHLALFCEAVDP